MSMPPVYSFPVRDGGTSSVTFVVESGSGLASLKTEKGPSTTLPAVTLALSISISALSISLSVRCIRCDAGVPGRFSR